MRTTLLLLFIALGFSLGLQLTPALALFTTDSQEDICATPAVIFCDNFENRAVGGAQTTEFRKTFYKNTGWFEQSPGSPTVTLSNAAAFDGTHSVDFMYPANDGAGGIVTDNGWGGSYRELYFRWYTKYSLGFKWSSTATKHVVIRDNLGLASVYANNYSFTGASNIVTGLNWTHSFTNNNLSPNIGAYTETTNQWHCYENHIRMNSSSAATDGLYESWIDGVQYWSFPNINVDYQPGVTGLSTIDVSGYWNCTNGDIMTHPCTSGAPQDVHAVQHRYFDNFVVSTQRIGCVGTQISTDLTPPTAPIGLTIR